MAECPCPIFDRDITGPSAWRASTIETENWQVEVPPDCIEELQAVVETLRANPMPVALVDATDFRLPELRKLASSVRHILDEGVGFAVIDRLPVEELSEEEATSLYCLFSNLVSRVVAGAWDGRILHDVVDTNRKLGLRVRGDLTNQEINWHTDNGFSCTPDYFALLCMRPAREGGRNSFASLHSAHNLMRERHRDLLPRLYQDFYWNRMGEHHPQDEPVNRFPYFEMADGHLKGRFNRRIVYAGYELAGEPFDEAGKTAVEAFSQILDDPTLPISVTLASGQAVYVNNRRIVHHRTPFIDDDDPARRRHLVRIYMRDRGPRHYLGTEGLAKPPTR